MELEVCRAWAGIIRARSYCFDSVLFGLVLMLLVFVVVVTLASFTRRPFTVGLLLICLVVGLAVEVGTRDASLAAAVVVFLVLAALIVRTLVDLVGSLRPQREPQPRTHDEREAERRARRRRLAA